MTSFPENIKVRPPTMNDVSAVLSLMLARDHAAYGEANMTAEHIRNFWQASDFNMNTDAWIVTRQDGHVIGYASVWHMQHVQVYTYFTALSEYVHLNIKVGLLELVEKRAQEFVSETPDGTRVSLATGIAEVNSVDQQLLSQMGYRKVRGQYRMEIEMHKPPSPAVWPEGISVWFLAYEGETIVGICLCKYWVGAGFISPLAVRLPWRRKGLGLALLLHSFAAFYRRGTRVVKLMVDTENPWEATRLYERVGMRVTQLYHQYEKELRPGK